MTTIAIIGGGFTGAEIAKHLKKHDVILFDRKDYFEYTPSVHKLITDSSYEKKIRVPYSSFLKAKLVKEEIKSVTGNAVVTESGSYGFDYLVVCSGSATPKQEQRNIYILKDGEDAKTINAAMKNVSTITIVGGGFTGAEIAGEIATKTAKGVKIINGTSRLMDRMHKEVGEKAGDFLHKKGVRMVFNKIIDQKSLESAEMVIWCIGIKPNTDIYNLPKDNHGFLMVEPTLQIKGTKNVFAGGDVTDVKEEKSAQNAEIHGQLIASNIKRLIEGRSLKTHNPGKRVMIVSLGDKYSIFCYGSHIFDGTIPSIMKKFVEVWTIIKMKHL